jgi:hypothetical protein
LRSMFSLVSLNSLSFSLSLSLSLSLNATNRGDVSEFSLPGRRCRSRWRRSSFFYSVKKTKTVARTSQGIYTRCRGIRLRAKSCLGQEMRKARGPVSALAAGIYTLSPLFCVKTRVRAIHELRSVIKNFPFVAKTLARRIPHDG